MFFIFLIRLATEAIPFQRGKECLKTPLFSSISVPSALAILTTLWTHHSEKHRLEYTVCYSLGKGALRGSWRREDSFSDLKGKALQFPLQQKTCPKQFGPIEFMFSFFFVASHESRTAGGTYDLEFGSLSFLRSGKTDPVQFKGRFNRAPFACKNGRFASSFLPLGVGRRRSLEKGKFVFQMPSPKPHLNRTSLKIF